MDLIAGFSVGVLLLPQSMAYAHLADLPSRYGLYSSTVPLVIYSIFTDTTMTAVGPVATTCILISSALNNLDAETDEERIDISGCMCLQVGIIMAILGFFQLGIVVKLMSPAVMAGFMTGAACIIACSQMKSLLRLDAEKTDFFYSTF